MYIYAYAREFTANNNTSTINDIKNDENFVFRLDKRGENTRRRAGTNRHFIIRSYGYWHKYE